MDGWPRRGLWAPLAIAEANTLLREGGYGLRVERCESGSPLRLTGAGAGLGLPLGDDPTWADLYRALVRLRRTRRTHDPAWLHRLARLLGGTDPAADRTPNGTAALGTGDETTWTSLPASRVERLIAAEEMPDEAVRCLDALTTREGAVLFPADAVAGTTDVQDPGLVIDRSGGRVTIGRSADDTAEIDWVAQLQTTQGGSHIDRERGLRQLRGWSLLASAVRSDPQLRMYCATQPVPAALVDSQTDSAMLMRVPEPSPHHPRHPGGTVVANLPDLLRPAPDGSPELLRQVIENRFEYRENELGYFLEHFVRPLLRTFRLALDTHHIGLYSLDEHGVGFELSPELQATGRIVITDFARVCGPPDVARSGEVSSSMEALVGTLNALISGFTSIRFDGGDTRLNRVRAAVDRVIAEELRYLDVHTADLLSCEQPLRSFVHTVPSSQDKILKEVLHTVQERTRYRRWNPDAPQPSVIIDLDLCGLAPLQRTLDAARAVSGPRPGAPEGIPELARPGTLNVLPTYAESTWQNFVESSGLGEKYPQVDWRQVYAEFFRAFARPWERLRTDTVNTGLARFVWDVRDAGGKVVFCTGRRERVRKYTEEVLAAAGVPDSVLLCMPDDRTRPISELKVEKLRELGELDVVAVFDDMLANRIAITKEFSGARAIAVEIPGLATERQPGQPVPDQAPLIATFETLPRTGRRAPCGPGLSNTHSLEELQLGELRNNRMAHRWAVHLTEHESRSIVDSVVADADRSAARTARTARAKFGLDEELSAAERRSRVVRALHHVFTRKQFLKGSRSNYQVADMRRDATPFVQRQQPIEVVLLGFPVKQCLNRLKASGPLPDLAELGGLARLRELQQAVSAIHPPGLRFNILTDGRHFRPRPASVTGAYCTKLGEYAELVGIDECTTIEEIDAVALRRLGPDLPAQRAARIMNYRMMLRDALRGFDITDRPLRTLAAISEYSSVADEPVAPELGLFQEMLMSVVYSVPLAVPAGADRLAWASLVFSDLYNLTDHTVSHEVRQTRAAVLRRAWHTVIRYLATLKVDEEMGYEDLFPDRVRLTVSAARPGRCGFTYLGGSGLLPWQGTGAVDPRGHLAVDFAISMFDRGFVPAYSPLLGPRQPWMMVPAQHTWLSGRGSGGVRLDSAFAARTRLRRK